MAENGAENDLDLIELALSRILRDNPHAQFRDRAVSKLAQDEEGKQLLLILLDQLNSLRAEREQKTLLVITENMGKSGSVGSDDEIKKMEEPIGDDKVTGKDVIREIRNVKKQNMLTHVALGIILVSGTLWRLSELFLAFKIRRTIIHPLEAIGGLLGGKGSHLPHVETRLPRIETPVLPQLEMPSVNNILNSRQFYGSYGHAGQAEEK
ncbi:uncharacterized protein LOC131044496 [Cryptomeria japonica]|uniref:uncharacterized protein LOC131044496 n=1 Tax=Cryptomeria japonica TaxID=3369 RepID=UPI0025AB8488|nr:uncharacterized protein LOC131044496 [Cryptomeria japonica]